MYSQQNTGHEMEYKHSTIASTTTNTDSNIYIIAELYIIALLVMHEVTLNKAVVSV